MLLLNLDLAKVQERSECKDLLILALFLFGIYLSIFVGEIITLKAGNTVTTRRHDENIDINNRNHRDFVKRSENHMDYKLQDSRTQLESCESGVDADHKAELERERAARKRETDALSTKIDELDKRDKDRNPKLMTCVTKLKRRTA